VCNPPAIRRHQKELCLLPVSGKRLTVTARGGKGQGVSGRSPVSQIMQYKAKRMIFQMDDNCAK
jgi:hypothetical protein